METEEAASTYGMMDCYGRESEVWDARLNASYREHMAPETGPGTNAVTDEMEARQLRKVQTAWIPWRDATCEVLHSDGIPIYGSLAKVDGGLLRHGAHGAPGSLDGRAFNTGFRVS